MVYLTAYKVCLYKNGKYYSCFAPEGGGQMEYPIGESVKPMEGYGPLAAFEGNGCRERHSIALEFAKRGFRKRGPVAILECDVVESDEGMLYVPEIKRHKFSLADQFIFAKGKAYRSSKVPAYTILCSEIKPLREVWRQ